MAISYEKLINWPFQDVVQRYAWKDSILYALGIGFGSHPADANELRFVYENGLETFPTMSVVLGHPGPWMVDPETGIDMLKVLHGEQHLTIHKPLPAEGTIIGRNKVVEIVDKGADKGALISIERQLCDESTGDLYSTQTAVIFARANGGFGGPVTHIPKPHQLPDRPPDTTIDISTTTQMALLYRLSGDHNPLHADPRVAEKAGFPAPILHGLASFGVAARAVLKAFDIKDTAQLKSFGLRFSAPVFPGETISTDLWRDGNEVSFRSRVTARDAVVLNNGLAVIEINGPPGR
ncbi:MAG: MaoC/PaaZ C-terminal domain-containing protein [Gammaproteobacteria bacterium]|nr:MaoC/PaaZ C-terminal domain-containing protein [Gammaproteobacteria bacterium]